MIVYFVHSNRKLLKAIENIFDNLKHLIGTDTYDKYPELTLDIARGNPVKFIEKKPFDKFVLMLESYSNEHFTLDNYLNKSLSKIIGQVELNNGKKLPMLNIKNEYTERDNLSVVPIVTTKYSTSLLALYLLGHTNEFTRMYDRAKIVVTSPENCIEDSDERIDYYQQVFKSLITKKIKDGVIQSFNPFNKIRFYKLTFSGITFENTYFYNIAFENCTFNKCTFDNNTFKKVEFTNCSFADCKFSTFFLQSSNFSNNNLSNVHISKFAMSDSVFVNNLFTKNTIDNTDIYGKSVFANNDISGTKFNNFISREEILNHFEHTKDGYIAYKVFGYYHTIPVEWEIKKGNVLTENVDVNPFQFCTSGIHVATPNFIVNNFSDPSGKNIVWKVLIPNDALLVVPFTDKFYSGSKSHKLRTDKIKLLESYTFSEFQKLKFNKGM